MRFLSVFLLIFAPALGAQAPAPAGNSAEPSPDTVIASCEGKNLTYGQFRAFVSVLVAPQQQAMALRNPADIVHKYFLWLRLAGMAENEKLDQQSPTKEQLYWDRVNVLMQAKLNEMSNRTEADENEMKKYYADHKDKYTQVRVKALYVSFSDAPIDGKKVATEAEAKAKIEKILAEIRGGADFVKMVKQYSEDVTSREHDGDLETFRMSDNIPDAIRTAVFSLKRGDVSEPVRQPNGFYLFRAEDIGVRSYQQVQTEIYDIVRQESFKKWLDGMYKSVEYKIEDPAFFKATAAAPVPAPVK
jgi:peptidyl-prolyl cis-trans isomerase C